MNIFQNTKQTISKNVKIAADVYDNILTFLNVYEEGIKKKIFF